MAHPHNTYRIQFHQDFTLADAEKISNYLHDLGIHTVYASPLLAATPGSTHGYDGIDSHRINPEIGNTKQLVRLKKRLAENGMGWLQDIVPNHMAFHPDNHWLMDLLEKGSDSAYKNYFDTSFSSNLMSGKMMVPVLGKSLRQACADQEINLIFKQGKFAVRYFEQQFPLSLHTYPLILEQADLMALGSDATTLQQIISDMQHTSAADAEAWKALHSRLSKFSEQGAGKEQLQDVLAYFQEDAEALARLLDQQNYRLCHWQETDKQINYRRFFTVNGLICMNVQQPAVFADTHQLIKEMVDKQVFDGLRIDHIDGLYNPAGYLRDLRELCGPETYIVAEKILETGEELPADWPIQGTTGYDFLALCNNVLTNGKSEEKLTNFYRSLTGITESVPNLQIQKKADILAQHMGGEVENLYQYLLSLHILPEEHTVNGANLKAAIAAFLIYFPVYRLYDEQFPLSEASQKLLKTVFDRILADDYAPKKAVKLLKGLFKSGKQREQGLKNVGLFFSRCMQFAGPVMAKGVEDTLMYTYHRHIGRHEVGDHPENFGLSRKDFHLAMQKRQKTWPLALNGSATHDTKRGEDQRARLQVLSAIPTSWIDHVRHWENIVEQTYHQPLPHPNDRYFLYQTLFGSLPMPGAAEDHYQSRLHDYLEKYLREGKERSDWASPNEEYEQAFKDFADHLLDENEPFYAHFMNFFKRYVDLGIANSLAQLILKFTCPGIPDVYQGSELWELGFVDPDNRRPVDYTLRQQYLREVQTAALSEQIDALWVDRYTGKVKLALTQHLLHLRKKLPDLFEEGLYIPLAVEGAYKRHILAFARRSGQDWLVVAVPLHLAEIVPATEAFSDFDWKDTHIVLPQALNWQHEWLPKTGAGESLPVATLFDAIPVAVVRGQSTPNKRSAGIVMHITSLPSNTEIGDLGEGAYDFVENLYHAGQQWWQVLPLGPTAKDQFHSPYSTWSALAGNPMLIDVQQLGVSSAQDTTSKAKAQKVKKGSVPGVDFERAWARKAPLLWEAFEQSDLSRTEGFVDFCKKERKWLDDYALFVVLRNKQGDQPWYLWDAAYRDRDPDALQSFAQQHQQAIEFQKWLQYTFDKQWQKLRRYCHARGVYILGDIPIYVSHDSADVWANPSLFALHEDGSLKGVAGVPPDYFNEEGQLWGMPVFNWPAHKKSGYAWWLMRIRRNAALYDKIRLDHFRAFSAYWEVPADKDSAKYGTWQQAPGRALFSKVKQVLGDIPFIAEDLGDIDEAVYVLRDELGMPGMKVLQFAFGEDMPKSPHIPHQYTEHFVAYTGTHDNNTSRGWFEEEADEAVRTNLSHYAGKQIDTDEVAARMIHLAYASNAHTAMVPMQDILNLPAKSRMNTPATTAGNWTWRMAAGSFSAERQDNLRKLTEIFDRG